MKYGMIVNVMIGAGLMTIPVLVTAAGFGGGWMHDKDTGTLSYTLAPDHGKHQAAGERHQTARLNGFGGGWVQDPVTRTLSLMHDRNGPAADAGSHSRLGKLESGVEAGPARGAF